MSARELLGRDELELLSCCRVAGAGSGTELDDFALSDRWSVWCISGGTRVPDSRYVDGLALRAELGGLISLFESIDVSSVCDCQVLSKLVM